MKWLALRRAAACIQGPALVAGSGFEQPACKRGGGAAFIRPFLLCLESKPTPPGLAKPGFGVLIGVLLALACKGKPGKLSWSGKPVLVKKTHLRSVRIGSFPNAKQAAGEEVALSLLVGRDGGRGSARPVRPPRCQPAELGRGAGLSRRCGPDHLPRGGEEVAALLPGCPEHGSAAHLPVCTGASAGSQCRCALSRHRISFTLWGVNYQYSANCKVFMAPGGGHYLQSERYGCLVLVATSGSCVAQWKGQNFEHRLVLPLLRDLTSPDLGSFVCKPTRCALCPAAGNAPVKQGCEELSPADASCVSASACARSCAQGSPVVQREVSATFWDHGDVGTWHSLEQPSPCSVGTMRRLTAVCSQQQRVEGQTTVSFQVVYPSCWNLNSLPKTMLCRVAFFPE
ncbi:uncharacterized protein WM294_001662 [Sarcoramphus papa]